MTKSIAVIEYLEGTSDSLQGRGTSCTAFIPSDWAVRFPVTQAPETHPSSLTSRQVQVPTGQ